MELWKKARKEDASDLEVVYDLAITQIIIEEFDEARDNLRYIQRFDPDEDLSNLVDKATMLIDDLEELQKIKEESSVYGKEYKMTGDKLRKKGKLNLAIEQYHKALEKNSYYGDVYLYLGLIQSTKENYERVEEIITNFNSDYFQKNKAEILKEFSDLIKEVK
jgi:tetratricopeptide (TPR) repeat protein